MARSRFSRATLVKVIVFAVVSAVFTIALAVKIGNLQPFSHEYKLDAVFSNASGVFTGDSVKLAGVDVGRVDGAKIENGRAVVTFTVDKSVRLTTDSVAALRWRNVLGLRFLYLYPGNGRGRVLRDGDTIPLSHTEDAADLGQFLNELGPILKAIDPDKANAFLDAMNTALSGNEVAVRALVDNGAVLAQKLSSMDQQIQSLIGSSDTVVSTYAGQSGAISDILDRLNHLGAQLDTMTADLDSFITNFADVQTQLHGILTTSTSNIDTDLSDLDQVVALLARNKGNLNDTLCTLSAGVAPYFQTTSWGEWFNVRVTKIKFADQNSHTIASASELGAERPPVALPKPYTCGQGSPFAAGGARVRAPSGSTSGRVGSRSGGRHTGGGGGVSNPTRGFENIGQFLKNVVGGGSDG